MRRLQRSATPPVLTNNAEKWTEDFRASGKSRPESRRYAHEEIRRSLSSMSDSKCFYCERLLLPRIGGVSPEVEHRGGVVPHERAYDWANLYLACEGCNGAKKGRPDIAIDATLDPCDALVDPTEHLDVYTERALPRDGSGLAKRTIDKLGLNTQLPLLLARQDRLREFWKERGDRIARLAETRVISAADRVQIERSLAAEYARPEQPFSWMFVAMLRRPGPLSDA